MNSHDQVRHTMLWRVKEVKNNKEINTLARLCDITDNDHLENIKKMLGKQESSRVYNGYRADTWIQAINSEIRYRTKLGYTILEKLAKNNTITFRVRNERAVLQ